jgi:hypothetical protein
LCRTKEGRQCTTFAAQSTTPLGLGSRLVAFYLPDVQPWEARMTEARDLTSARPTSAQSSFGRAFARAKPLLAVTAKVGVTVITSAAVDVAVVLVGLALGLAYGGPLLAVAFTQLGLLVASLVVSLLLYLRAHAALAWGVIAGWAIAVIVEVAVVAVVVLVVLAVFLLGVVIGDLTGTR